MGKQELIGGQEMSDVRTCGRTTDVRRGMGLYEKLNILTDAAKIGRAHV